MVAVGLLGGLAVGGMKLFENQSKAQKTIEANHELTTIVQQMRTILSREINCTASFAGIDVDAGIATRIKKEVSPGVFNDVFVQDSSQPNNVYIKGYQFHRNLPGLAADEGIVVVTFSRGKAAIKEAAQKSLKYTFTKDANNKIVTCSVLGETQTELWKRSPGNPLDIYYNSGSVIVGSENPDESAAFEIRSSEKGFLPPRLTNAERLGIANPAKGLLVFDADESVYYFWDGSSWSPLGGGDNVIFY